MRNLLLLAACCSVLLGCDGVTPNNPYPASDAIQNILYGGFSERPKYLDPARSYSTDESRFIDQIYEPPLQYAYKANVYELIPGTAASMPQVIYHDSQGAIIDGDRFPEKVAETIYRITLQPGILYQPHPAFAKDEAGEYAYHHLDTKRLSGINALKDFSHTDTRELTAEDYVYEIKRLAWPDLNSPIYETMSERIVGLKEFHDSLMEHPVTAEQLRDLPISGVKSLDPLTYEIHLKGIYRQFPYWLAMEFFCPIPWEADVFYNQKPLIEKNIVMNWYPVGTGPFMLTENNPNARMVLTRNPHYRTPPQVEKAIYSLENESIPAWNKFLQGYYDASVIDSDNFGTAIQMVHGQSEITPSMREKNISLIKSVQIADYYWGFNMRDKLVGGYQEKNQLLRQAISIAIDTEEFIDIFMNGRGKPAQFFIPTGLFGSDDAINPYVYDLVNGKPQRKSIQEARQLLAKAGYPGGRNPKTGESLIVHYDTYSRGGPEDQARTAWLGKQFRKLGIDLEVRYTDYNRFREKLSNGNFQFFFFGWVGDYPDPENFLGLLYGPNGHVENHGMNDTNYNNPEVNRLYEKMVLLPNGPERLALIHQIKDLAQKDAPIVWGFYPEAYSLKHAWLTNIISNEMVRNGLKYYRIDGEARAKAREAWNQPLLWPIALCLAVMAALVLPVWLGYRRKERHSQARRYKD